MTSLVAMAQTFGIMLYVLGFGLGLVAYVLGLAICVLDSITDHRPTMGWIRYLPQITIIIILVLPLKVSKISPYLSILPSLDTPA